MLPGGADWQLVYRDGMASIDTRYTLRTHDGALIYLATRGVRHGSVEVLARLGEGEDMAPEEYYFRMSCRFEAGDPRYAWLARSVIVGSGLRVAGSVVYDVFAVT